MIKRLKQTREHSLGYHDVASELEILKQSLQQILQLLGALKPSKDNIKHANAIQGMSLAWRKPLRDSLGRLTQYQRLLNPLINRHSLLKPWSKKIQWATHRRREVENLRARIVAHSLTVNIFIALTV